ncbi:MAG: protein-glutamate O-methyltransferase CheR [Rhodospirillales bacterium]|jgi:chemotaxis protein methyltransferase CheR|nr:protein-glutamate O-methyltransferase CheR [Rhodospirillales bacterium]
MTPADFTTISELLKRRSGLILPREKAYLLESRLRPVMRKHALADLAAVAAAVLRQDAKLTADVIDAMTTNETLFFRDVVPFAAFRETVLPALLARRSAQRSFRILCAAASTGQEPYSLAMILVEEATRLQGWSCEIIAFDISPTTLERARAGLYTQFEVQRGMPTAQLLRHFRRVGGDWQIASELRAMVRFREFNLLDDLAPFGRCDVVFCRNVLIYFDPATKVRTLANIGRRLPADGYLFLGASETVMGLSSGFAPVAGCSGLNQPTTAPARAADPARRRAKAFVAAAGGEAVA